MVTMRSVTGGRALRLALCEREQVKPEQVLRAFMHDLVEVAGGRAEPGDTVIGAAQSYAWSYFLRYTYPQAYLR
jgi:hypothetical protein